jgi:hypothetical protein
MSKIYIKCESCRGRKRKISPDFMRSVAMYCKNLKRVKQIMNYLNTLREEWGKYSTSMDFTSFVFFYEPTLLTLFLVGGDQ